MQCTDCKLQGISCPYTYMVVPGGQVPDTCPYKTGMELSKDFLDTTISGHMQIAYPEWNFEEIEKELRRFFNGLVKSLDEDSVSFNMKNIMKDIMIKVETQKFMEWVESKHKGETPTITLTTTSQSAGDGE